MPTPLVNPVIVHVGQSVHVKFVDQDGNDIVDAPTSAQITPNGTGNPPLPSDIVNITMDADFKGATIVGVKVGSGWAYLDVFKESTQVRSQQFQITVPWSVSAVGTVID